MFFFFRGGTGIVGPLVYTNKTQRVSGIFTMKRDCIYGFECASVVRQLLYMCILVYQRLSGIFSMKLGVFVFRMSQRGVERSGGKGLA